jgi:hypothetical protein
MLTVLGFAIAHLIIGTIFGRILFVKRLGNSVRYSIENTFEEWTGRKEAALVDTRDLVSARDYGLWSLPFWFLTVPIFLVLAPTATEKAERQKRKLAEELEEAEKAFKAVSQ